jgi:hypothetical protein
MTVGRLAARQPRNRGQSCACPHLLVPGCFTRPPGTSTRNHPHDPTTSKPVVPGGIFELNYSPWCTCGSSRFAPSHSRAGPILPGHRTFRLTPPRRGPETLRHLSRWTATTNGGRRPRRRRPRQPHRFLPAAHRVRWSWIAPGRHQTRGGRDAGRVGAVAWAACWRQWPHSRPSSRRSSCSCRS